MNDPVRQHYIPQSYLKYFATQEKDKFFVEVYDKRDGTFLPKQNISSICFKRDLYTIKTKDPAQNYFLEHFYANNIDNQFTEIHDILVNPDIQKITEDQKQAILSCLLSLYFRTTKFLHGSYTFLERIIDEVVSNNPDEEDLSFTLEKTRYEFKKSNLSAFKAELREDTRVSYVLSQLGYWEDFYRRKLNNGLLVCKVSDELITSDNPVIISSPVNSRFHLYDETNIIQIPIDKNHYLFMLPDNEDVDPLFIARGSRDKMFALTNNSQMERLSERWIISDLGGIKKHLADQAKYNDPEEAGKYVEEIKVKVAYWQKFDNLSVKHGGNLKAPEILALLEEYNKMELFQDDENFLRIYNEVKKL